MVVSASHFTEVTNGYERTTSGLWTHKGKLSVGAPGDAPYAAGDINANRGDGSGTYYFGGKATKYLYMNTGGNFILADGTLTFNPAANTINTAAIQANAVSARVGSFAATVNWATPSTGAWWETPINTNATVTSATSDLRIEANFTTYHTLAGADTYIGFGVDGIVQQGMAISHSSTANTFVPVAFTYYASNVVGTRRWSIHMLTYSGQAVISNAVLACLWITEQKR